jgi:hypothetical protein
LILGLQPKSVPRKELTPYGESNTDYGAVSTLCAGLEAEFLGGGVRPDGRPVEEVFGGGIAAAAGELSGIGEHEQAEEERKDYRNGFYQRVW